MKHLKDQFHNLETRVLNYLREAINNSNYESKHVQTKAIKVDLFNYKELTIINDRLTFLDSTGLQYDISAEATLEDLLYSIDFTELNIQPDLISPQNKTKKAARFGQWTVSKDGDMGHNSGYSIFAEQLTSNNRWIAHMSEKRWIDWNEFIPAYFQALKNAGIQYTNELVHY